MYVFFSSLVSDSANFGNLSSSPFSPASSIPDVYISHLCYARAHLPWATLSLQIKRVAVSLTCL